MMPITSGSSQHSQGVCSVGRGRAANMPYNTEKAIGLSVNIVDSSFTAVHQFADKICESVNIKENTGYSIWQKAVIEWKKSEKNYLHRW